MAESALPYLKALSKAGAVFQTGPAVVVTSEPYQYTSLKAGQFRLLSIFLEPVTGFLTCNLDVRDLASSKRGYKAISYCWGNHVPTNRLLCSNGQSLLVTKSAAEILEFIVPQNPTEFFWIDQLCINQADLSERSAQVSIMAQIYSSTKQVIAWLGRGDKSSESAVSFVETLFGEIEDMERKNRSPTLVPFLMSLSVSANILNMPVQMRASQRWKALSQLLSNPWFERMWVMQEVIMACAETSHTAGVDVFILVSFEKCAMDFNKLANVLSILESDHLDTILVKSRSEVDSCGNTILPPGLLAIKTFSTFRRLRVQGKGVPLHLALENGWHFKASDDRDKVYAVMAFADEAANTSLPDYESTVEDVYISQAAALLGRDDDYPLLLHMAGVGLQRSYPTLPSWVPDFSSRSNILSLRSVATTTRDQRYDASGGNAKTEIRVDLPSLTLGLQAIQIDKIEIIFRQPIFSEHNDRWYDKFKPSRLLFPNKEYYKTVIQWLQSIESFLESPPPILGSSEPTPKEILWQTIVGDYPTSSALIDSPRLSRAFVYWYEEHRQNAGKFISSLFDSCMPNKPDFYELLHLFEDMKNTSLSCQPVFGTAQKRLLGYGPEGLLRGDTVCIIKGAVIPFLLRPDTDTVGSGGQNGKRWKLVGGCFVHGLMYGEGLSMGEMEEFVIT